MPKLPRHCKLLVEYEGHGRRRRAPTIHREKSVSGRALGAEGRDEGHEGRAHAGAQQPQHVRVVRQQRHGDHLALELRMRTSSQLILCTWTASTLLARRARRHSMRHLLLARACSRSKRSQERQMAPGQSWNKNLLRDVRPLARLRSHDLHRHFHSAPLPVVHLRPCDCGVKSPPSKEHAPVASHSISP